MLPASAWTVSVRELPARHNGVREVPQLHALPQHVFTSRTRDLAVLLAGGVVSRGMFRGCVAAPRAFPAATVVQRARVWHCRCVVCAARQGRQDAH